MKYAAVFFFLTTLNSAQANGFSISRGGTVENGGNSIMCCPTGKLLPGEGCMAEIDALDYVRALATGYRPDDFAEIRSWEAGQARLAQILRGVSSGLYRSFQEFALSTRQIGFSEGARSLRRIWKPTQEHLYFTAFKFPGWTIPDRCSFATQKKFNDIEVNFHYIALMRTVTRRQNGRQVEYLYDPLNLANLGGKNFLQYSILMTHEWLWDHTNNLDVNQATSVFLHSRELERMTNREIRIRLHELGLNF